MQSLLVVLSADPKRIPHSIRERPAGHLRLIDMAMQILKVCLLSSGLQVKPGAPAPVDAYLPDMQPVNC